MKNADSPETRAVQGGVLLLLLLSYPALYLSASWPLPGLFVLSVAAAYAAEILLQRQAPSLTSVMSRAHFGETPRALARDFVALVFLARADGPSAGVVATVAVCVGLVHGARVAQAAVVTWIRVRRRMPLITRGVDLSALRLPPAPPAFVMRSAVRWLLQLNVLTVAAITLQAAFGWTALIVPVAVVSAVLAVVTAGYTVGQAFRQRRFPSKEKVFAEVQRQVSAHAPSVILYFSGSKSSAYQVNMWLSTLDALEQPSLIVLREKANLPLVGATSSPIVCFPTAIDLMRFDLSSVHCALYVANVGANIHLLREPGMKHVFIGHGDSDKVASVNPYGKVYDELWVASQGGRDRWARADVGVRDEDIVEVGRPQLHPIRTADGMPGSGPTTVLYAPTWEGWDGDPYCTSLMMMGPDLVAALLGMGDSVRVLYKPHPLTGIRSAVAQAVNERIIAMIEAAEATRRTRENLEARARYQRLVAELASLGVEQDGDEADAARKSGSDRTDVRAHRELLEAEAGDAFWAAAPPSAHRAITGAYPVLYECFNRCDLLISDISSVVADFVESQKPYVVTNPAAMPSDHFREEYPSAGAAYLLTPQLSELPEIMAAVQHGPDPLAEDRERLRTYLLGPSDPPSLDRFRAAVGRLVASPRAQGRRAPHTEVEVEPEPEPSLSVTIDLELAEDRQPVQQA
jgi:hypothetical protein